MATRSENLKAAKSLLAQHGIATRSGHHASAFAKTQPAKVLVKTAEIGKAEKLLATAGIQADVLADPDE